MNTDLEGGSDFRLLPAFVRRYIIHQRMGTDQGNGKIEVLRLGKHNCCLGHRDLRELLGRTYPIQTAKSTLSATVPKALLRKHVT